MKQMIPVPGMHITESVRIVPGEYDFFDQDGLVIDQDGITIDGCGATWIGGHGKPEIRADTGNTEEFGYESRKKADNAAALGFFGTGIRIAGRKNVIIRNLNFKGFDMGAHIVRSDNIILENCDFTGCFTDPAWGWDDHGFHGGILMEHTHHSTIRNCRAMYVWDALNMRYSDHNTVAGNTFSHTSDTGLKLWNSSCNTIHENDFSYGIRIDPGEIHARDSSCVLIESGSNFNVFRRNDMTHGGDGLFVRVLNGWMSTNNLFEENDCSYANNNAIEAWADNNIYLRNKANYSSYGFWLGNSDNTILIGNEAAFNGKLHHNAPEAFGNAGIAVVNGSGSHYLVEDNDIHDNMGPGIAVRYRKDYPSFHWIIQNNRIIGNRDRKPYKGHGIYIKNARFLTFGQNEFRDNDGEELFFDGNVSDIRYLRGGPEKQAPVKIVCDSRPVVAGKPVTFSVKDARNIRWDLGDGTVCTGNTVAHTYDRSGFYRLGVTCDNGQRAAMDFQNVYVCEDAAYMPLFPNKVKLSGSGGVYTADIDEEWTVTGGGSLRITADKGRDHVVEWDVDSLPFDGDKTLSGYFRYLTDTEPDWKGEIVSPIVCLYQDDQNYMEFKPNFRFAGLFSNTESRNNWVKLRLDEGFTAEETGKVGRINRIKMTFHCMEEGYTYYYLDAFCIVPKYRIEPKYASLAKPSTVSGYPKVICEGMVLKGDALAPVYGDRQWYGDATPRVVYRTNGSYGVEFGTKRYIDRMDIWFYENTTETENSNHETVPRSLSIQCLQGDRWITIRKADDLKQHRNVLKFPPVLAEAVKAIFAGDSMAIYGFQVFHTAALPDIACTSSVPNALTLDRFEVKLRKECNGNGNPLGDLIARVYTMNDEGELRKCLFETVIPEEKVVSGGITAIPAGIKGRQSNKKYALALGQTETARSRTMGDYYRWIGGHAGYDETFAIYTDGQTKKSDYDWGTAWLKVFCQGICADYSHDSEHIGTRFGLEDMQCRYMTFTMPDSTSTLTDGIAAAGSGFRLDDGTLTIDLKGRTANCLLIWLDQAGTLMVDRVPHSVRPGLNQIERKYRDRIIIRAESSAFTVYEIEVIG